MKIVLLFLIVSFGFGSSLDYFDKYRRGDNWQKDVDRFLYSDTYIDYLLKDKDVKFGYFDNPTNIIICYKNRKKLDVYGYNNNFYLKTKFENILVGRDGDKWKEGDGKTPIGVYTLKYKIDDNKLDDFYGPLAYPTNYPNLYDSYLGKGGHGIWIHGFPKNNPNRKFNTKGCIALPNNELVKLSKTIDYQNSILIISTKNLPQTDKKKIKIILKEIFKWRYAWKYNRLEEYLSFYDKKHFKKENRFGFGYFAYIKKQIFSRQKDKILKFKDIKIIPYPSVNRDIYQVSFDEFFKSAEKTFIGRKVLYLKLKQNRISIFLEN